MPRKKVKIQFIENNLERKASYRKRKNGLMKKVNELSVLCGVEACAVIYNPDQPEPDVWPSESGARNLLERFQRLPKADEETEMLDQERLVLDRINRLNELAENLRKENEQKEAELYMYECLHGHRRFQDLDLPTLDRIRSVIEDAVENIDFHLDEPSKGNPKNPPSSPSC